MSLEIANLKKSYGNIHALKSINLKLDRASTFALLGVNGAGKSTLIKIILNLVNADQGNVKIGEYDSTHAMARLNVAYLPEKFNLFPYYTPRSVLELYGKFRNITKEELQSQINFSCEKLEMGKFIDQKVSTLSKGQLQRTGLATTLIGNCSYIFYDEPFSGLDPISIKEVKELFKELNGEGKTIMISSHILSEIERICDSFGIINEGEIIHHGEMNSIPDNLSLEDYFYSKVKK